MDVYHVTNVQKESLETLFPVRCIDVSLVYEWFFYYTWDGVMWLYRVIECMVHHSFQS